MTQKNVSSMSSTSPVGSLLLLKAKLHQNNASPEYRSSLPNLDTTLQPVIPGIYKQPTEKSYLGNENVSELSPQSQMPLQKSRTLSLRTAMRLKQRLRLRPKGTMNAQTSMKQHPSGALANKKKHVVLKPLSRDIEIVPPPLFKSETATRSMFTERSDVPQATHEARVTIRFPILEKAFTKAHVAFFLPGRPYVLSKQ